MKNTAAELKMVSYFEILLSTFFASCLELKTVKRN